MKNVDSIIQVVRKNGMHRQLSSIWKKYPVLEQISFAYGDFISQHAIDETGKPLLLKVLRDASAAFDSEQDNDERAVKAYIRTLIESAQEIFSQRAKARTPNGDIRWSPFEGSLSLFTETYGRENCLYEFEPSEINAEIAKAALIIRVLPHSCMAPDRLSCILDLD